MKHHSIWILLLTALLVLPACSGGGGGGGSSSQSVSETGAGFGINANDQLRRYQTFIAGSHPTLTGVEVRVRKINTTDFYSSLSVELWETDAQHRPSILLSMASIPTDTLGTGFATLAAPLSYYGLVSGKEYAVVLEQFNAFGANAGFEWVVSDVSASTYFGKQDNGVWTDESPLGDGWLVVYTDDSTGTNPVPGSLDTSFGTGGTATAAIGTFSPWPRSMAIQSDGKVVVAFFDVLNMSGFMLARFNVNGSLDTTFNTTGRVTTPMGTQSNSNGIALQPDGKIVAVGGSSNGSSTDFALARYNIDGSLDTTFNSTGTVTTHIGTNSYAVAAAIQPDGKIVAAGDSALARYNADGSPDTTFNSTGSVVLTAFGNVYAVAIQPDGKIVVAGSLGFTLARYNSDGSPDTTFNGTGTVTTSLGMFSAAGAVVMQPDGKIVAAGHSDGGGMNSSFTLVRYNANGSLDMSFNSTGTVTTAIGSSSSASGVVLQPDGKIVAAGSSSTSGIWSFAFARYNPDGTLDSAFSSAGTATTAAGTSSGASAVALQPDGKIAAVGSWNGDAAIVRYRR